MFEVHTEVKRSALYCDECGFHLSKYQETKFLHELTFKCRSCSNSGWESDLGVKVLPTSAKFMNVDPVRKSTWYHATSMEHWDQNLSEFDRPVFIGTRSSAMRRRRDSSDTRKWWLYKVKLQAKAPIYKNLMPDDYVDGATLDRAEGQVVRYVNIFETPGSISLALPGEYIQIIDCKEAPLAR